MYLGCHLLRRGDLQPGTAGTAPGCGYLSVFYTQSPRQPCKTAQPGRLCGAAGDCRQNIISGRWLPMRPTRSIPVLHRPIRDCLPDRLWRMTCGGWKSCRANYYNFHPGSHVGQGMAAAVEQIAQTLNEILCRSRKPRSCWRRWPEREQRWEAGLRNCGRF